MRYVQPWSLPRRFAFALVLAFTATRSIVPWKHVAEQATELSISIVPSRRKHGLGQELLDALLEKARGEGHAQVSLSVEKDSPAVGFYERNGFTAAGESEGGLVMVRQLA